MLPCNLAEIILLCHKYKVDSFLFRPFMIELQLDYTGLMAIHAYSSWKRTKNSGRTKVGCFDFKIFKIENNNRTPLLHSNVILDAYNTTTLENIESIFNGNNPFGLSDDLQERACLQGIQLAMLEQEINWGSNIFQSWSHFNERPRDFIMAYLRRIFEEPNFLDNDTYFDTAASGRETLMPPLGQEWQDYINNINGQRAWLDGDILDKFISTASGFPDNPNHSRIYS